MLQQCPKAKLICLIVFSPFFYYLCLALAWAEKPQGARVGIWVEAENKNKPFISAKNYDELLRFLDSGAFSDVFVQVYRGGRSWYPSVLADDTPFRVAQQEGVSPLKIFLSLLMRGAFECMPG